MYNTYYLIKLDAEIQSQNWDPWTPLGLDMPSYNPQGAFNTPEVKKAYRQLARKYHPDKVKQLDESE